MDNFIRYTQFSVKDNQLICYVQSNVGNRAFNYVHFDTDVSLRRTYKGFMTNCAIRMIYKRISLFNQACEFYNEYLRVDKTLYMKKLVMVTVTLSQAQFHSDKFIKQYLLRDFLLYLRAEFNVVNYIWKAEKQKNGNIHFHILIDRYVDQELIQEAWNTIQNSYGYMSEYYAVHHHCDAPSTDIHICKSKSKTVKYMAKYLCKSDMQGFIDGSVWRCSESLLYLTNYTDVMDTELQSLLDDLESSGTVETFENEWVKSYIFKAAINCSSLTPYYNKTFHRFLRKQTVEFFDASRPDISVDCPNSTFVATAYSKFPEQLDLYPMNIFNSLLVRQLDKYRT